MKIRKKYEKSEWKYRQIQQMNNNSLWSVWNIGKLADRKSEFIATILMMNLESLVTSLWQDLNDETNVKIEHSRGGSFNSKMNYLEAVLDNPYLDQLWIELVEFVYNAGIHHAPERIKERYLTLPVSYMIQQVSVHPK